MHSDIHGIDTILFYLVSHLWHIFFPLKILYSINFMPQNFIYKLYILHLKCLGPEEFRISNIFFLHFKYFTYTSISWFQGLSLKE